MSDCLRCGHDVDRHTMTPWKSCRVPCDLIPDSCECEDFVPMTPYGRFEWEVGRHPTRVMFMLISLVASVAGKVWRALGGGPVS